MGILGLFWNCKDSKNEDFKVTYPEEKLGVIKAKYSDGSLAIGAFNRGYSDYADKSNYPYSLIITIDLNPDNCNANGLPTAEENELANKLEDELVESMSKISPTHNVGHLFNSKKLDIYAYVRDKNKITDWLQTETKKSNLQRTISYEIVRDCNWENIANFMTDK